MLLSRILGIFVGIYYTSVGAGLLIIISVQPGYQGCAGLQLQYDSLGVLPQPLYVTL